ncbi:MAG: UDP-N-acetylmuramate dehydrogenase [Thiotrichaceae bacterium]
MEILENVSLKPYNTFGVASMARYFTEINTLDDVLELVAWRKQNDLPCLIMGGGSNLLFKNDYSGLVAHINLQGKSLLSSDEQASYVRAGAGEIWHDFVRWTIDQGYAGLENLSLIPGTVGAAPVQNIGAYGVELVDLLHSVEAIDLESGDMREFDVEACQFAYRDSYFKSVEPHRYLITAVTFRLPHQPEWKLSYAGLKDQLKGQALTSRLISDTVMKIRQSKLPDPAIIGNAGSFFKNPILPESEWELLKAKNSELPGYPQPEQRMKTSAAWMIDQCGWKGRKLGAAGVYENHALVLVNHGGATGSELWDVAEAVIQSVQEKFQVNLEPEPRVI